MISWKFDIFWENFCIVEMYYNNLEWENRVENISIICSDMFPNFSEYLNFNNRVFFIQSMPVLLVQTISNLSVFIYNIFLYSPTDKACLYFIMEYSEPDGIASFKAPMKMFMFDKNDYRRIFHGKICFVNWIKPARYTTIGQNIGIM